jgi:hypothetical protein
MPNLVEGLRDVKKCGRAMTEHSSNLTTERFSRYFGVPKVTIELNIIKVCIYIMYRIFNTTNHEIMCHDNSLLHTKNCLDILYSLIKLLSTTLQ